MSNGNVVRCPICGSKAILTAIILDAGSVISYLYYCGECQNAWWDKLDTPWRRKLTRLLKLVTETLVDNEEDDSGT